MRAVDGKQEINLEWPSGAGLVLSSYMVHFSHSIEQRKQIYNFIILQS